MADFFEIVHGANGPTLDAVLTKADGTPQNLTGATVTLYAERRKSGLVWLNGVAVTIVDAPTGAVRYTFVNGDWTALEASPDLGDGIYRAQWHVAGLSPTPVRFPTEHPGWFGIHVLQKVS
jgi:hypothetical protein